MLEASVITVSDSVAQGTRDDRSGPEVVSCLVAAGFEVSPVLTVPDDEAIIASTLKAAAGGPGRLVITTGGTGFGPRDVTPEATRTVLERDAPALAAALQTDHPMAALSRGLAGTIGQCLILNLPGSPAGAVESLEKVLPLLPHALELLAGGSPH